MERQTRIFPLIFDMDLKAPWCKARDMLMIRDNLRWAEPQSLDIW